MKILEFFQDNSGGLSSSRLILIAWAFGILVPWIYLSVKSAALQPVPESVITMFGVAVAGKTVQRFGEKEEPDK